MAHFVGGRAGNAGEGLEQDFNPWFLFFQSCMQDFILMFLAYPWFVRGFQQFTKVPVIGPHLASAHTLALKYKKDIAPYGGVGLMVFVFIPIWSTGPLVGVIVGYLLGLGVLLTFTSVIVGK